MMRFIVALGCVWLWWAAPAWALRVEQTIWGFDNQMVAGEFQPVSVLVRNDSGQMVRTAMQLEMTMGGLGRVGAPLVEDVFLSPGSARWVQFYPYTVSASEWRLSWRDGRRRQTLDLEPLTGPQAAVVLDGGEIFTVAASARLPRFPEALFPLNAAATDSLTLAVLDHEPAWEVPRRKAFLGWLYRGGTLYLAPGGTGNLPQFTGDLATFNSGDRYGRGRIIRGGTPVRDFTLDMARQLIEAPETDEPLRMSLAQFGDPVAGIAVRLRSLTKPRHAWGLFFALCLLYLVLVCPVNWLLGRRYNYWVSIAFLAACVVLFSAVLLKAGRRGYGERAMVHTLSLLRPTSPDTLDVTQFGSVFVIAGDQYTIEHAAPFNLYGSALNTEAINGVIESGPRGRFHVDIPLYSWRDYLYRGEIPGTPPKVVWSGDDARWSCRVRAIEDHVSLVAGWIVREQKIMSLDLEQGAGGAGDVLMGRWSQAQTFKQSTDNVHELMQMYAFGHYDYQDNLGTEERFRRMAFGLVLLRSIEAMRYQPPDSRATELFLLTAAPPEAAPRGDALGQHVGYALYQLNFNDVGQTDE